MQEIIIKQEQIKRARVKLLLNAGSYQFDHSDWYNGYGNIIGNSGLSAQIESITIETHDKDEYVSLMDKYIYLSSKYEGMVENLHATERRNHVLETRNNVLWEKLTKSTNRMEELLEKYEPEQYAKEFPGERGIEP